MLGVECFGGRVGGWESGRVGEWEYGEVGGDQQQHNY